MERKVLILTNDNVFFLLIETFVESRSDQVNCVKLTSYSDLHHIEHDTVSLIIIDGKMTDISPIELCYLIRYEQNLKMAVWLFTEIKNPKYINKAFDVGITKVLEKPFDPKKIAIEILEAII